MAIERRPIDKLNAKISSYETKISSYGTLQGLVSTFQSASESLAASFEKLTATPADTTLLTASAGSTAVPGTYALNVSKLAQAQNLVATGQASSTAAIGDGTATTVTFDFGTISGGTLTDGIYSGASFASGGGGTTSITIDGTNNTLEGIRDAINDAGMGVTATIVNDGSGTPYRLALTSTTGTANSLKITTSGGDGSIGNLLGYDPAGTQNLTQTLAAQNASLTVNGIAIASSTNTISEAIQGVTLTLKNTTTTATTLAVERDTAAIKTAASGFVDAYNALNSQIKSRSAYGSTAKNSGALAGDGTLRLLQEQLRAVFNTPASGGTLTSLAEVGIAFQKDGSLALDSSKLDTAMAADFADVTNLFSSATGFATRLGDWADSVLDIDGLIDTRTKTLKDYVENYNDEIERLENQMKALQKKYTTEYTTLNLMLTNMTSTSAYLASQLGTK
jgi:flagellar hook-associated protein 2